MALLKTVGLCKYFGGLKAVNHVDMEVQQGQVLALSDRTVPVRRPFSTSAPGLSPPRRARSGLTEKT